MSGYIYISVNLLFLIFCLNITNVYGTETIRRIQTEKWRQCNIIVEDFSKNWHDGSRYLSRFLDNLQSLNCPQFEEVCSKQAFAFTKFTSLMYLKFCNESELMKQCFDAVENILQKQSRMKVSGLWGEIVNNINFLELNEEELKNPCLQVAMYDQNGTNFQYAEVIDIYVPFCSIVWCGFADVVFQSKRISVWTCMPQRWVFVIRYTGCFKKFDII